MTESMIERVARVITEHEPEWDNLGRARAAIEAMREPTQQMRLAGIAEWSRPDPTPEHDNTLVFNAVFRAMIDAALQWPAGSADRAGVPLAED